MVQPCRAVCPPTSVSPPVRVHRPIRPVFTGGRWARHCSRLWGTAVDKVATSPALRELTSQGTCVQKDTHQDREALRIAETQLDPNMGRQQGDYREIDAQGAGERQRPRDESKKGGVSSLTVALGKDNQDVEKSPSPWDSSPPQKPGKCRPFLALSEPGFSSAQWDNNACTSPPVLSFVGQSRSFQPSAGKEQGQGHSGQDAQGGGGHPYRQARAQGCLLAHSALTPTQALGQSLPPLCPLLPPAGGIL